MMKILSTSALSAIAATNFLLLCNFSAVAQSFVYDVRETYSESGLLDMDEDDKPVFGSSKGSSTSLFVMGPAEEVTVKNDDDGSGNVSEFSYFNRHSYAVIDLFTSKSNGKTIKEFWVDKYPVAEDNEFSGANPTLCQLDADKKNVMLVVNGESFSDFIGKAIFGKPVKAAAGFTGSAASVYPTWHSKSLSANYSGISTTDPDPNFSSSVKFFYGTSYTSQTTAKLNTTLTALVYYKNYSEALEAVIADLESKGYVEGNYE